MRVLILAALVVLVANSNGTQVRAEDATTWETIAKRWQERSTRMPAIRGRCSVTTFMAAGEGSGPDQGPVKADGSLFQPHDLTMKREQFFLFEQKRWRLESRGSTWAGTGVVNSEQVNVSDGNQYQQYYLEAGSPSPSRRFGGIHSAKVGYNQLRLPNWAPWTLLYHPFDEYSVLETEKWQPQGELRKVPGDDGETWLTQWFRRKDDTRLIRIFVDPTRDFALRKLVRDERARITVHYRKVLRFGWLPDSWKSEHYSEDGSKLLQQVECKLTSLEPGIETTTNDFEINFPQESFITDYRGGINARKSFYIRRDGTRREITKEDRQNLDFKRLESKSSDPQPITGSGGTAK